MRKLEISKARKNIVKQFRELNSRLFEQDGDIKKLVSQSSGDVIIVRQNNGSDEYNMSLWINAWTDAASESVLLENYFFNLDHFEKYFHYRKLSNGDREIFFCEPEESGHDTVNIRIHIIRTSSNGDVRDVCDYEIPNRPGVDVSCVAHTGMNDFYVYMLNS